MHEYVDAWKYIGAGGGAALLGALIGLGIVLLNYEKGEWPDKIGWGLALGAFAGMVAGPSILASVS